MSSRGCFYPPDAHERRCPSVTLLFLSLTFISGHLVWIIFFILLHSPFVLFCSVFLALVSCAGVNPAAYLASPHGDHPTPRRGALSIYTCICINVFFWPFGICFSSGRGSFLVLSAQWREGSPPGPRTKAWALVEVRGKCSGGSKWQVRSGRDSEHVEPSTRMKTHVQVKTTSNSSHVIYGILNFVNVSEITWWRKC